MSLKKKIIILLLALIFAFSFRLYAFIGTDNYHGIAIGKTFIALNILKNPSILLNFDPAHAPLHQYLIALSLILWKDPTVTPRILSLIFALLTFIPFYLFVKLIFDEEIALFSLLILAAYPLHVLFSTLSTAEITFNFFLIISFYYFAKFKKENKLRLLIISAVLLTFACMERFEGMIFIPLLTLFLLFSSQRKYAFPFLFISIILPVSLMGISYYEFHDPLVFLHNSDIAVQANFNLLREKFGCKLDFFAKTTGWLSILYDSLGIIAIFGLLGIIHSLSKRKFYPPLLFLIPLAIFTYKTTIEQLNLDVRYSITLGILLIPFSAMMLKKMLSYLNIRSMLIFILLIYEVFGPKIALLKDKIRTPYFVKDVAHYLKDNVKPNEKILIDWSYDDQFSEGIMMESNLERERFLFVPRKVIDRHLLSDERDVWAIFKKERPDYLIYSSDGWLTNTFPFLESEETNSISNLKFDFLYESDPFKIYKIFYN